VITIFSATTSLSLAALDSERKREVALEFSVQSGTKENFSEVQSPNEKTGLWITGDSVILGIRSLLESYEPIELINARVGRQISELLQVVAIDSQSVPDSIAILNLGNNGPVSQKQVRELFDALSNQPHFLVVNAAVPRGWRDANNKIVADIAKDYPKAHLIDWYQISKNHPEYFAPDGVHLLPTGANVYVSAILNVLEKINYRT
jgi:ribosomal protein S16